MKKIDMKVALKNSQQILGKWMGRGKRTAVEQRTH